MKNKERIKRVIELHLDEAFISQGNDKYSFNNFYFKDWQDLINKMVESIVDEKDLSLEQVKEILGIDKKK